MRGMYTFPSQRVGMGGKRGRRRREGWGERGMEGRGSERKGDGGKRKEEEGERGMEGRSKNEVTLWM